MNLSPKMTDELLCSALAGIGSGSGALPRIRRKTGVRVALSSPVADLMRRRLEMNSRSDLLNSWSVMAP